jgi:hypothetical protein
MSRAKKTWKLGVMFLGITMLVGGVWAQEPQQPQEPPAEQQPPAKPKPAARGVPGISEPDSTVENQNPTVTWQEDTSPPTGLQVPGVGTPELAHSYWMPGLVYGANVQSSPFGQTSANWYATQYLGGDFTMVKAWSHSTFDVNYSAGGYFTSGEGAQIAGQPDHGWFQNVALGYSAVVDRWQIQAFDYASYLPESSFGFAGGTGIALPGSGSSLGPSLGGLTGAVMPNQSIYSATGPRYSNVFAPQITYSLSRRSSVTVAGSYGILRFTQTGNVDNDDYVGSIGYNYQLNQQDSIGILYRFSSFHYAGQPQALGSHVANFVYTKKIAKRLGMSLYAGPQITTFRVKVGNDSQQIGASAGATLSYAMEHRNLSLSYYHGLSGGGGVLVGSDADQVTFTVSQQLGRVWSGNVNAGYARNGSLGAIGGIPQPSFNDWFVGGGVSRPFGRNINFSAAYTARFERANQSTCLGVGCNTDFTQHMISISLQWHTRPLVL